MASRKTRCALVSFRSGKSIYEGAGPAPHGTPLNYLLDEPLWNICDNAAVESFLSSLKTEITAWRIYQNQSDTGSDVFGYIERFSTLGYLSPNDFETKVELA